MKYIILKIFKPNYKFMLIYFHRITFYDFI